MQEPKSQLAGTLLLILTVAALVSAVLGFRHLSDPRHGLPDDGVTWVDSGKLPEPGKAQQSGQAQEGGQREATLHDVPVLAVYVTAGGPGAKAGIHLGDQVIRIGPYEIHSALDVAKALWQLPIETATTYTLRRNGIEFQKDHIFIKAAPRDSAVFYQYLVGVAYLVIGLFVYYRRTNAQKSLQFFVLCIVSFIASSFHYSGKLNTFDELMYWGNVAAGLIAPAIFLHFCLTFHEVPRWLRRRGTWLALYLPSTALFALMVVSAEGSLRFATPLLEVRWFLDRLTLGFEMLLYLGGTAALALDYARSEDPVVRRQLKFLRNGALVGLLPFAILYVAPYMAGSVPTHIMNLSVLSLGLIPLTWAYAITRYRLMDVDIIFQQGYVYTLATLAVIGTFYVLIFLIFNTSTISPSAFVVLISFATLFFQPIRRWIQEQLDRRLFYRDRYDARLTLIEFARELSSETDLNRMLASASDRLLRTLSIHQIGFFLADDSRNLFHLHSITQKSGRPPRLALSSALDLRFLEPGSGLAFENNRGADALNEPQNRDYLFFERPKHLRDIVSQAWPQSVRDTLAELDFTYYVACRSRGRVVAYFGVSRTTEGDFLSSDDIDLLVTVSRYVAIAVENTRLYSSLQRKVDEYERLKEFSENIVESINVGILAVDLNDCVESWNTQIEKLTGITRTKAVGRRLCDLFSPELCQKFDEVRGEAGIHNAYKVPLRPRFDMFAESGHGNGHSGVEARESLVNLAITPLVSKDLQQIGRLIIFDDVTDRDDLERRLVQADKLSSIGLLAAGVAHEVNTPLAVISTYAQMLAKQVSGDEHKSKLLEKIAKQTFRASEIVNSLLNFSRTSPTEFTDVDLNRVVRETVNLIEHQLQQSGIEPRLDLSANVSAVRGNAGKLQQVFLNLFLNARDAMPSGGALTVRTWADSGFVHVEIADNGQGIPPEHLTRIYDPFFTTKAAKKGTGLGLSITYGIVHEHNGVIEVDSVPGQGTRFRLEFPAQEQEKQASKPPGNLVSAALR